MESNDKVQYKTIYRLMSYEEFEKFINGENIVAKNKPGPRTSAVEPKLYFASELYDLVQLTFDGEYDVLCEFETKEELLEEGQGEVTWGLNCGHSIIECEIPEYYISEYNNKKMKLINCCLAELDLKEFEHLLLTSEMDYWDKIRDKKELSVDEEKQYEQEFSTYYKNKCLFKMTFMEFWDFITNFYRKYDVEWDDELYLKFSHHFMEDKDNNEYIKQNEQFLKYMQQAFKHKNAINYIKKFDYDLLNHCYCKYCFDLEDELELEAHKEYVKEYYGDDYYDDYEEDYYTADEIAVDIDTREGEIEEVIKETEELAKQNDKEANIEQDGQTQAD